MSDARISTPASPASPSASGRHFASVATLLLALSVLLALWTQAELLDYLEWGDESETIVAAKMLASGMSLYAQVFNHHGPLTFLTGYVVELLGHGHAGIRAHRIAIAVLQVAAMAALYLSPAMPGAGARRLVLPLALTAVFTLLPQDGLYGHMYLYQVLAGLTLVAVLAQYTLPSLLAPERVGTARGVLGNVGIASLPWFAITYLPAAVLLFACSLRRAGVRAALAGVALSLAANLAFLGWIGSYKGWWVDHIYVNSQLLPQYNGGQDALKLASNVMMALSSDIGTWFATIALAALVASLFAAEGRRPWRSGLLAVAVMSLLIRGMAVHGVTFWYAGIAIATVLLARLPTTAPQRGLWLALSAASVLRLAWPLIVDPHLLFSGARNETTEFGQLARQLTGPDDRIVAYSFANFQYIAADRLPASGNFFYLPWQKQYLEHPMLGIGIDTCADLAAARPKLMYIDRWMVWDRYSWGSYAGCIDTLLASDYQRLPGRPIYVRNDLFERAQQLLPAPRRAFGASSPAPG